MLCLKEFADKLQELLGEDSAEWKRLYEQPYTELRTLYDDYVHFTRLHTKFAGLVFDVNEGKGTLMITEPKFELWAKDKKFKETVEIPIE